MFAKKTVCKVQFLNWFCIDKKTLFFANYFIILNKSTVIYICKSFIDFNIVFWGDNSYYPIKFNIFLYIIPCYAVIFKQNPQNFIISKTIVFSLFKNMICRILICLTAQKSASKVAIPVWKKNSVLMHFSNTLDTSIGDSLIYFWRKLTLAS